ncbi:GDSL-type esterase/lipase family protein [Actinomycetospora cinnamomea]|uniref:Putative peptidoglycan binding protein n=1 Tax=Actinomycetospora cinnamomea TaxID=663609 RepID=A0A2U1EVK9_9PSEU|nr:GDSL-type esterase/lipase family protein [Actinomycetospora cinnamomea]PVZ03972.1 putative peptidoglycan binding protein [Actinomycetospora cinnamomea]
MALTRTGRALAVGALALLIPLTTANAAAGHAAFPPDDETRSYFGCPLLLEGQRHPCVVRLQNDLNAIEESYALPGTDVFGPATRIAVLDFQGRHRLPADGNVGGRTADLLDTQARQARSASEPQPAPHPPGRYAALGDSFASGEGTGDYVDGTDTPDNRCHRSGHAYGTAVGRKLGMETDVIACSGARTVDHWLPQNGRLGQTDQRSAVGPDTTLVTVTLGGNDIGFAPLAVNCAGGKLARESWSANCVDEIEGSVRRAPEVREALIPLLRDVHERAPRARVLVTGYPRLFPDAPGDQCPTGVPFISWQIKEMTRLNALATALNAQIRSAAAEAGPWASYVDLENALAGHDACSSDPWVHLVRDVLDERRQESYHPTVAAQGEFAQRVLRCYRDPSSCDPSR